MMIMQNSTQKTGYPSIDRPWLQYYSEDAINGPLPEESIYEMIWDNNKNRQNEIAIEFFKSRVTYKQLFTGIDQTANAFLKLGVKSGDIVTLALLNSPENVMCFYALNKIGAIANFLDFRTTGEKFVDAIKSVHSDVVVICDRFAENAVQIQDQVPVKHWIVVTMFESVSQPIRIWLKYKNRNAAVKQLKNRISWSKLQSMGKGKMSIAYKGGASDVACIFHTSGTTSLPKSVMLTNGNLNAISYFYKHSRMELLENERFLSHIPPFLAYSTVFTIHMPLSKKMTVTMVPSCPSEKFADLLMELKPNHAAGGSAGWRLFIQNPKVRDFDFSFFKALCSGNDKLEPEVKAELNEILAAGGCQYQLLEGYGMTECSSVVTGCWPDVNPLESIGIPHCKIIVSIFDPEDSARELTYGEKGEICICSPTVMAGYYNDPEATSQVLKMHPDSISVLFHWQSW